MTPDGTFSDAAVRDTLAAVFASPPFTTLASETLLSRIIRAIGEFLRAFRNAVGGSSIVYYTVLVLTAVAVGALLWRVYQEVQLQRAAGGRRPLFGGAAAPGAGDPWGEAQRLAAAGDYTGAAHALYAAILSGAARAGLVRLHDAKTVGDYLRELRRRAPEPAFDAFRDFARSYEYVVYGVGACDRTRYERLSGLARGVLGGV